MISVKTHCCWIIFFFKCILLMHWAPQAKCLLVPLYSKEGGRWMDKKALQARGHIFFFLFLFCIHLGYTVSLIIYNPTWLAAYCSQDTKIWLGFTKTLLLYYKEISLSYFFNSQMFVVCMSYSETPLLKLTGPKFPTVGCCFLCKVLRSVTAISDSRYLTLQ